MSFAFSHPAMLPRTGASSCNATQWRPSRAPSTLIDPDSTTALDDHTVEFTLKEPSAIFGSILPDILVVNADVVKENEVDGDWGGQYLTDNVSGS